MSNGECPDSVSNLYTWISFVANNIVKLVLAFSNLCVGHS